MALPGTCGESLPAPEKGKLWEGRRRVPPTLFSESETPYPSRHPEPDSALNTHPPPWTPQNAHARPRTRSKARRKQHPPDTGPSPGPGPPPFGPALSVVTAAAPGDSRAGSGLRGAHLELGLGHLAAVVQIERGEGVPDGLKQLVLQAPHSRAAATALGGPRGYASPQRLSTSSGAPGSAARSPDRGRPRPGPPPLEVTPPRRPRPLAGRSVLRPEFRLIWDCKHQPNLSHWLADQLGPFPVLAYTPNKCSPP